MNWFSFSPPWKPCGNSLFSWWPLIVENHSFLGIWFSAENRVSWPQKVLFWIYLTQLKTASFAPAGLLSGVFPSLLWDSKVHTNAARWVQPPKNQSWLFFHRSNLRHEAQHSIFEVPFSNKDIFRMGGSFCKSAAVPFLFICPKGFSNGKVCNHGLI